MTTYTINQEHNGIEITFDSKPAAEVRDTLKGNGFRWHRQKALWYAKNTPDRLKIAEDLTNGKQITTTKASKPAPKKAKSNKYGVKVGDIFSASWGYDQTNVDFFQVVALAGTTSVRVREVYPQMIEEAPTCSMAADRTYKITSELLPYKDSSIFIDDQERGDLKRLKSYAADGTSNPEIQFRCFNAHLVHGETITTYESWYA